MSSTQLLEFKLLYVNIVKFILTKLVHEPTILFPKQSLYLVLTDGHVINIIKTYLLDLPVH